ncbi:protein involved in cell-cycle regulation of histone transcription [Scheffersomyces stipitis CBS 6054]|uniref:Protein HIR n=1 Tax=Scheffersomyces stipitis (strain ATCC 58785 / CBS 6054 / NBRC 10063 / NRRL Y-11545) TaxID=322104 RepID=A3LMX8_PICST|nr:protein involved in cell-cycle regulation of histone transcription [Scheffersomyces stipitis CBS 6054]ABN64231.2 protein involved in cell-cycle regulation of histone transcription [Scheffersomyces stipitis CBS 6054]
MRILKLPWFGHKTENKNIECYAVSINADGTRLASGGLDGNVKIWDTSTINPFLKLKLEPTPVPSSRLEDKDLPVESLRRPMCSMSRHNGVVTSVKFSPDGRFLASGSDDKICLIWEKDEEQSNRPKQFGEVVADLEHWTVRKRLVAHDNDIQDICWSPDGGLLVTVGLDRSIIIWNGLTFERIKRYDIHQSMVKGVVFDPANKFFATASDDRTVRIFRYYKKLNEYNNYEFQMEHIVMDPFKKSPLTSYFRRMSWSPDGQHIAVPNATNGPVPSIAIIRRGNWATDISLIGHEAPCEVCSFSPRLFDISETTKKTTSDSQFSTILATGGQDQTLAIWSTATSRPLVVAENIVNSSITDICWTPDGQALYLSCLDGSITCVSFDKNELGRVVNEDIIDAQLHRYGADRESAIFPESVEQLQLEYRSESKLRNDNKLLLKPSLLLQNKPVSNKTEAEPVNDKSIKPVNRITQNVVIMKNGKKKVAPTLVSASSTKSSTFSSTSKMNSTSKKIQLSSKMSQSAYFLPRLGIQTSVHGFKIKNVNNQSMNNDQNEGQDNDNEDMGIDENTGNSASSANISEATLKRQRNKIKRMVMEVRYPSCFKFVTQLPEALFNNQSLIKHEVQTIINNISNNAKEMPAEFSSSTLLDVEEELLFSVVLRSVSHNHETNKVLEENGDKDVKTVLTTIEIRNGQRWRASDDDLEYDDSIDFDDPTRVLVSDNNSNKLRKYTLFFPFRIQHVLPLVLDDQLKFIVFVSFEGTIQIVRAESGTYHSPSFSLGGNVVTLISRGENLMVLTNRGLIYTWKLSSSQGGMKCIIRGVSIASVLNTVEVPVIAKSKPLSLVMPNVRVIDINPEDGSPYIITDSTGDIFSYSISLGCWTKIVDSWYFLAVDDDYRLDDTSTENKKLVDQLICKSLAKFTDDVRRLKINSYDFSKDGDGVDELYDTMLSRFQEVLETKGIS